MKVQGVGSVHQFPLESENGPLRLSVLLSQYPTARGLLYSDDDAKVVVPAHKETIKPPRGGWGARIYSALFSEVTPSLTKDDALLDIQSQLVKLLSKPQTQLVMAPERKISPFDGKVGEVREFVTSIRNAFQRYSIPQDQKGPFLLDYLRGGPKAEVKAMLSEEKKINKVLDFLLESYGDRLATGELQRLFLERRQRHGEGVRDYALDIERRFLRLTRHDGKLYSSPDTTLAEQFKDLVTHTYVAHAVIGLSKGLP